MSRPSSACAPGCALGRCEVPRSLAAPVPWLAAGKHRPAPGGKRVTYADLPTPSPADQAAYLADLDAIDPAIVSGRPSGTFIVSNSMSTCLALTNHEQPQRILTETIFALDNEQAQLTREEGTRIVEAIRRNLCPAY